MNKTNKIKYKELLKFGMDKKNVEEMKIFKIEIFKSDSIVSIIYKNGLEFKVDLKKCYRNKTGKSVYDSFKEDEKVLGGFLDQLYIETCLKYYLHAFLN